LSVIKNPDASPTIARLEEKGIEYRIDSGEGWTTSKGEPVDGYILLVDDKATSGGW
jgi:hypothetical protein